MKSVIIFTVFFLLRTFCFSQDIFIELKLIDSCLYMKGDASFNVKVSNNTSHEIKFNTKSLFSLDIYVLDNYGKEVGFNEGPHSTITGTIRHDSKQRKKCKTIVVYPSKTFEFKYTLVDMNRFKLFPENDYILKV